jgi:hypothetical protein
MNASSILPMSLLVSRRLWPLAVLAVAAPVLFLGWWPPARETTPAAPKVAAAPAATADSASAAPAAVAPVSGQAPAASPSRVEPPPGGGGLILPPSPPASSTQPELDAALAHGDAQRRAQEFFPKFAALVGRDPEAALAYLRGVRRGQEFTQGLFILIDNISRRDPDRAVALAAELATNRDEFNVFAMLFSRFAQENVALALERLPRVPAGGGRESALRALLDAWARSAPDAAMAWARALPDVSERNLALESVFRDLATRDPGAAITRAPGALAGTHLERVLEVAFNTLAASDPSRAAQLLEELPPGDVQTIAVMDVARALATRDVTRALAWANSLGIDFTRWLALSSVLSVWAQREPLAAANYVVGMPAGPALDYVAGQFAAVMAAKPQDGILWAEALASPAARDAAFVTLASAWAQRAPLDAVRWAQSLAQEPVRTNALAGAHAMWRLQDPRAAQAWLDAAPLPAGTKARILAPR